MKITLSDLSFRFGHAIPRGKRIVGVKVSEDGSLECELGDKPDTRHVFVPHEKYPQFCKCGYAEHVDFLHLPTPAPGRELR